MRRLVASALVLLAIAPATAAADGAPDRSFGSGGAASFAPQRFSGGVGVAGDAQGRILVAATVDDGPLLHVRAAVLRLLPGGLLDTSFGVGGVATIAPPAPYATTTAEAIAVDAQGRIVVAGEVADSVPAVARLLPDGRLDPAFAAGGILVASDRYRRLPGWWRSIAFDGASIVVAGAVDDGPPFGSGLGTLAVLARIAENGVPDAGFGSGGFLELPLPGVASASAGALAVDHSGRIVLGLLRASTADFPGDASAALVRLTAAGGLDSSFGSGGEVKLGALMGNTPSVIVTRTGTIVAFGGWAARAGTGTAIAVRLQPSGRPDETFGTHGEIVDRSATPRAGALDCQGDLIVSAGGDVRRFGPDGRLDASFRSAGAMRVPVGSTDGVASFLALALLPGGAVVLAGSAADGPVVVGGVTQSGNVAIAVARLVAACPVADSRPPAVALTCSAGCRRVTGTALDDPVGRGVRRVLLGVQRIAGTACQAWDGRRFAPIACGRAATRLVAVPLARGAFRTPALRPGRYVVRAVAVDRAGNRSPLAVRRFVRTGV
jgi:uncharacterized delta-60 repeat protein